MHSIILITITMTGISRPDAFNHSSGCTICMHPHCITITITGINHASRMNSSSSSPSQVSVIQMHSTIHPDAAYACITITITITCILEHSFIHHASKPSLIPFMHLDMYTVIHSFHHASLSHHDAIDSLMHHGTLIHFTMHPILP